MNNFTNTIKYKVLAPVYDTLFGNRIFNDARRKGLDLLKLQPGERVLIVGVGTGQDFPFLPHDIHVVGIDISEAMLARANKKVKGSHIRLLKMNAEKLSFEDEAFDVVVLNLILSVVENPNRVMLEALRVLNKSGRVLVFDKFLPDCESPSIPRKVFNLLTSLIGTDINRRFGEITDGLPVRIICDIPSLLAGSYRVILLKKQLDIQSPGE